MIFILQDFYELTEVSSRKSLSSFRGTIEGKGEEMQKVNTRALSGFMELSPEDQLEFDRIKRVILNEHLDHGFCPVDVPLIYRKEVLLAKAGGETEKQIYQLKKGDNDLALRFDLTVPLAAYVTEKQQDLTFPFKVSQINKVYRGERPQKGRYREFYQCDADVIGRGELDIAHDAEVISVIYGVYKKLDFGEFTIRVSNRKLLTGFLDGLDVGDRTGAVMAVIDRAEKVSEDEFRAGLVELGLGDEQVDKVLRFTKISGGNDEIVSGLGELGVENELFGRGLDELVSVMDLLGKMGVKDSVKIDLMIVRGLDYYTGTVFETLLNDYPEVGSIGSGGRYENLASNYSNEKFPGVGASIGLTRMFAALKEIGVVKSGSKTVVDVMIVPFASEQFEYCYELADRLRAVGKRVDVVLMEAKIGKKLAYADKMGVKDVIVVGEDEVGSGRVAVKNMESGGLVDLDEYLKNA